jgi:xanthine dehydrogenase accessory factor
VIVWRRLADLVAASGAAALVSVHEVRGSAPREAGARMVVRTDGAFHGTIGGGQLEWQMLGLARDALAKGRGAAQFVDQALGPDLGQCCGGRVTVLIETFDRRDLAELQDLAGAEREGAGEIEACVEEGRVRRRRGTWEVGSGAGDDRTSTPHAPPPAPPHHGSPSCPSGPPGAAARARTWRERLADPLTPVAIFGAGHVGRALVLALAPLPFAVRWIDSRENAFPPHIPGNVTPVPSSDPEAETARLAEDSLVVVMTHEHPLDLAITAAALARGFPFVGLIGSETKRARFEKRFRELGLKEERIRSLACPIGLSGIAGKEPAIIAASAVAQLLKVREKSALRSREHPSVTLS